jgi:tetratricopeptide (TPR) repeat protein
MSSSDTATQALLRPDTLAAGWDALPGSSVDWVEGQRIGPFRLIRRLGKGGMGLVWLATQLQPLRREVAIKVMLQGRRSTRAEAYFEVERQALAQLSHRAIAQIHDAGRLPDGALFFAMEYVPGVPLKEYLQEHPLSGEALARLMIELCAGIQHAHQRGLIHRDLKPQNVLVQNVDGVAMPKIIDFGIALGAAHGTATPMRPDQVAGTPAYMSPEQRQPGPEGIDARSDIYAMGVMLAECLYALAGMGFVNTSPESVLLRHQLAQSLGQMFDPLDAVERPRLSKLHKLPAELRAIAVKAMAADREQRYHSAAAMADDLNHWLQREPVRAMGSSRGYTLRCFMRRNALASGAAALITLALLAGTALALYGLTEARAGRSQAEQALQLAESRRNDAERLIQFMLGDFADKLRPIGRLDLLDSISNQAIQYLGESETRTDDASALARARALRTLGEVQVTRQQFDAATLTLERAAALLTPWTGDDVVDAQPETLFESGQVAFWRGLIAFRQREDELADRHWQQYLHDARAFDAATDDHVRGQQEIAYAVNNLGTLAMRAGRPADALRYFSEAVAIRLRQNIAADNPDTLDLADTYSWLAQAQDALGDPAAAYGSLQQALELTLSYGRTTTQDARQRRSEIDLRLVLAWLAIDLGRDAEARSILEPALALAIADVTTDPTQTRRRLVLARTAFSLSRLHAPHDSAGLAALQKGTDALSPEALGTLSKEEQQTIETRRCLAELHHTRGRLPDCVAHALENNLAAIPKSQADFPLLDSTAELVAATAARHREQFGGLVAQMRALLHAAPASHQNTLRYLLRRRDVLALHTPTDRELPSLGARILAMQTEAPDTPKETP